MPISQGSSDSEVTTSFFCVTCWMVRFAMSLSHRRRAVFLHHRSHGLCLHLQHVEQRVEAHGERSQRHHFAALDMFGPLLSGLVVVSVGSRGRLLGVLCVRSLSFVLALVLCMFFGPGVFLRWTFTATHNLYLHLHLHLQPSGLKQVLLCPLFRHGS